MKIVNFLGIKFYNVGYQYVLDILLKGRKYLVIPAAYALARSYYFKKELKALQKSDIAIFDSGFFCFSLRLIKNIKVDKFSGYKFLNFFLDDVRNKNKKILSLDPSFEDLKYNKKYLQFKKFKFVKNYVCPMYQDKVIEDKRLIKIINEYKPEFIISNIAGGKQETLALYIIQNATPNSSVICSGAALAFLTGRQAPITNFIDEYYLGWLIRLIYNPKLYLSRILFSFKLFFIVFKNKVKIKNI
jgi:N-acetylglucosaminyldiphosphoundecaprenol N-acetyl-beta-D-mannosaminyltransferase